MEILLLSALVQIWVLSLAKKSRKVSCAHKASIIKLARRWLLEYHKCGIVEDPIFKILPRRSTPQREKILKSRRISHNKGTINS